MQEARPIFGRGWAAVSAGSNARPDLTGGAEGTRTSTSRRCVEARLACDQRVEKRGEGIVLDKRPGAAAEIYATSIVPVHRHANSIGACDVIRRAGDEKRARCVDVQRLEREPIRLWAWLVRVRHLSCNDDVKGDTNLGRSQPPNLVRTVGDNADLHGWAQLGQNGRRFRPGSQITQPGNKRRCTIWGKDRFARPPRRQGRHAADSHLPNKKGGCARSASDCPAMRCRRPRRRPAAS
jgi:hypothetical protein